MFSDKQLPYLPAGLLENKTQLKISHVPFFNAHIEELSCISKTEYCGQENSYFNFLKK
jgi:hypothetical protein